MPKSFEYLNFVYLLNIGNTIITCIYRVYSIGILISIRFDSEKCLNTKNLLSKVCFRTKIEKSSIFGRYIGQYIWKIELFLVCILAQRWPFQSIPNSISNT